MKFFFHKITEDTKKLLNNLRYLIINDVWYIKILSLVLSLFVLVLYAIFVIFGSIIFIVLSIVSIGIFFVVYVAFVIPSICILYVMDKGGNVWQKIYKKSE